MHARLRGPNKLLIIHHLISLVQQMKYPNQPRPYMNIKVAAFTVSEKSINTRLQQWTMSTFQNMLWRHLSSSAYSTLSSNGTLPLSWHSHSQVKLFYNGGTMLCHWARHVILCLVLFILGHCLATPQLVPIPVCLKLIRDRDIVYHVHVAI